jgi:serine/threonine protein kinase
VGDYELLSLLGEGGMGVVHLARKPGGPRVALKVLRPHIVGDHEARARLAREVGSLERIRSRWIAEIVDADPWAPTPYVATRYIPGLSLHDHVPEEGPIRGDDLRWFARCLAEGLASVHAAGVLHRDVKPSNVLLEGRTPILIDFGLARVADDPKLTHTGWLLGTPGYLAPEILYGDDATTASDVHSWAATVAFAGTGHPPFGRGPAMAIMDRVRRGEHDLAGLPDDVRSVVAAALDPDPARRPRVADLRAWLSDRPATTAAAPLPGNVDEDPFTLPLAIAAHDRADAPTWLTGAPPETDPTHSFAPATRHLMVHGPHEAEDPDDLPLDLALTPARESPMLLLRRGVLLAVLALAAAAAVTAWPYVATAVLLLGAWLLRTCTMVVTAAGDRRRLRGARWYDVLLGPLSAP